ncbi:hypothetical protein D356_00175, partial [Enterococcus faecium SD2A-2]
HVMVLGKLRKHFGKQTVGTKIHLLIERFTFIQRKPKRGATLVVSHLFFIYLI